MSVPGSHVGRLTLEEVTRSLEEGLRGRGGSGGEEAAAGCSGYLVRLRSLSVSGERDRRDVRREKLEKDLFLKFNFSSAFFESKHRSRPESNGVVLPPDCYRYQKVASGGRSALRGPDMQRSSCMWHLQAGPGAQLELRMEWLLPECRDRLVAYDSLTPSDSRLITSVYGCSRHERVVRVLSSGEWMTVVWKQGLYNYKDPFSLSAQAWDRQGCNSTIELKAVSGVQGTLSTPFFPSYYPPDTNCTWSFTVRPSGVGLSLEFEGYELSRASYNQACTQGQWTIQNRRCRSPGRDSSCATASSTYQIVRRGRVLSDVSVGCHWCS
uniref:CUB domain-containing protein n=1 Tax=Cyclopterus lumpus TaxID=8103 RepID=A0A8C2Z6P5_CYCLU